MKRFAPLLALALGGCMVGPNYRAPETPAPATFGETAPGQPSLPGCSLDGWWKAYNDPELNRLVDMSLAYWVDIKTGFGHSSDTFFYQVAGLIGIDRLAHWANEYGFGAPTGIDQ